MPGMNGLEVCAALKELETAPPVILLTAKDDLSTRAAGMALGVSEFVVKPVNNRDLLARIQTQLSTRQWEREIDRTSATIDPNGKAPKMGSKLAPIFNSTLIAAPLCLISSRNV